MTDDQFMQAHALLEERAIVRENLRIAERLVGRVGPDSRPVARQACRDYSRRATELTRRLLEMGVNE